MARSVDSPEGAGASTGSAEDSAAGSDKAKSSRTAGLRRRQPWSVAPAATAAAGGDAAGGGAGRDWISTFRRRVLPRSLLGVASLILAFAIGAGFSGVVLYSYYQYKLNQTDQRVNSLISGYKDQFAKAEANLNADVANAKAAIAAQLKTVQEQQASPTVLAGLIKQVAPSVFFVHTMDVNGQPSVGTAFVVSSNGSESLLVTSYTTVAAATHAPGPPVYVRQGTGSDAVVTVRTWDPQYDLALLVLPRGNLTKLVAAPNNPAPVPGDRLFAVSGLASAGAKLTQGVVVDVLSSGMEVDNSIGSEFQGGPLVTQSGQVVAVASRTYSPLGFTTDAAWYVPYVGAACNKVLSCPGGSLAGSH
ncbi:MAG TPA: serine protease [Acidimicrobiales bacterium]|nr:serine protease [Acidimicrobiales bacterium]